MITRCSNNYGPWQFPEKFLPQMILNALDAKPLPIYGDGLYVRDWIHVEDHCAALEQVLLLGRAGEIYNIGAGGERPNLEMAKAVLNLTGRSEASLKRVTDRPGHDRRYAVEAAKLRGELGWEPAIPLEAGLTSTVRWYRENRSWWERILSGDYLVDRKTARAREGGA
jgi:dTDP-glucose 4,6-dehydratase